VRHARREADRRRVDDHENRVTILAAPGREVGPAEDKPAGGDKSEILECFEGVESVDDGLLEAWTARLRAGDRGAEPSVLAKRIPMDFALRQWVGLDRSKFRLAWLADALHSVVGLAERDRRDRQRLRLRDPGAIPRRPPGNDHVCHMAIRVLLRGRNPDAGRADRLMAPERAALHLESGWALK
jgi:hypothetical protein